MARTRIVVGTTAVGSAADGPVQHHGPRSYSRRAGDVKAPVFDKPGLEVLSKTINPMPVLH